MQKAGLRAILAPASAGSTIAGADQVAPSARDGGGRCGVGGDDERHAAASVRA